MNRSSKICHESKILPVATPVCVWQAFTTLAAVAIISSETKLGRVYETFFFFFRRNNIISII